MSQDQQWRVIDAEGNECGPYTAEQLQAYAADGTISPTTLVWTEGLEAWISALEVEGLFPVEVRRPQLLTGPAVSADRLLGRSRPSLPEGASPITVAQPPNGTSILIVLAMLILLLGAYFAYKLSATDAVVAHDNPATVPAGEVVPVPEGKSDLDAMTATLEFLEAHEEHLPIIFAIIIGPIILTIVYAYHDRCPKCKKRNALRLTGREGNEESSSFTGSTLHGSAEWSCRLCGHTLWRAYSRESDHSN